MTHDLTLGGAGATIDVDGYDNSISGVIDGGKLTKTGAGTLLLTGANTYTGDTEIDAGTLAVLEDANFGANASNRIIIGNATLRLDESFNTARNIDLTDANSTINVVDDGFNTLTGKLSGTGVLNKTGTGTLVLGGANGYQGGTDIQSGILQISDDGNLGDAAGAVAIAQGAELQFSQGVTSARDITLGATGSTINTMTGNSTLNGVIRVANCTRLVQVHSFWQGKTVIVAVSLTAVSSRLAMIITLVKLVAQSFSMAERCNSPRTFQPLGR
ncbi:hypothetical protein HGG76_20700 [Ochrobactrum tritici]|uniref:Outer membrane autotransporter n=1 Tax=Brucella tritici TaxID=94626 RepID=A0A7X6JD20_9HYPH|nr:hypothetical protein [Brucella tritici]